MPSTATWRPHWAMPGHETDALKGVFIVLNQVCDGYTFFTLVFCMIENIQPCGLMLFRYSPRHQKKYGAKKCGWRKCEGGGRHRERNFSNNTVFEGLKHTTDCFYVY